MVPEMHKPRAFSHYFVDISQSALLLPEASAVLLCDDFMSLMVSNLMVNSLAPYMTSVCVLCRNLICDNKHERWSMKEKECIS